MNCSKTILVFAQRLHFVERVIEYLLIHQTNGSTVIHLLTFAESSLDFSTLKRF